MGNAAGAKFKDAAPMAVVAVSAVAGSAAAPAAAMPAKPVAAMAAVAAAPAALVASADAGKKLYEAACMACHAAGIAGSPKFGDKAAWAPRAKLGLDAMTASVIKGKGAMPPRGGSQGTDAEIKQAVAYILAAAK